MSFSLTAIDQCDLSVIYADSQLELGYHQCDDEVNACTVYEDHSCQITDSLQKCLNLFVNLKVSAFL